jgi:hypothetical protein
LNPFCKPCRFPLSCPSAIRGGLSGGSGPGRHKPEKGPKPPEGPEPPESHCKTKVLYNCTNSESSEVKIGRRSADITNGIKSIPICYPVDIGCDVEGADPGAVIYNIVTKFTGKRNDEAVNVIRSRLVSEYKIKDKLIYDSPYTWATIGELIIALLTARQAENLTNHPFVSQDASR